MRDPETILDIECLNETEKVAQIIDKMTPSQRTGFLFFLKGVEFANVGSKEKEPVEAAG
jgi:hypothetical protein